MREDVKIEAETCMQVCVCERDRGRDRERQRDRERRNARASRSWKRQGNEVSLRSLLTPIILARTVRWLTFCFVLFYAPKFGDNLLQQQ